MNIWFCFVCWVLYFYLFFIISMKKVLLRRELVTTMQIGCQQLKSLMMTFTLVQKIVSISVRKNSEGATDEERGHLEVVGEYHLGGFVNRFRHGSLMRLPDSAAGQIPTVIFGTINGVIGVIASLPHEQYVFLEKLQSNLRKVIKGVGGLSHEQWRSFTNEKKTVEARNFLDGGLIESFPDLNRSKMDEISKAMDVSVEELCKRVEELTWLHWFILIRSFFVFLFLTFL